LGLLIVLVAAILAFNYFSKGGQSLGPAQSTEQTPQQQAQENVNADNLPGNYTVKEGDTLFSIANLYYRDEYKFNKIARANNISDPNLIEVGTVLTIPR